MTTRKTHFMEEGAMTHSKGAMAETRFMEETTMTSSMAMAIGTLFTAGTGMTQLTAIRGLIGSGATKEMTFFAATAPARQQTMAATESKGAPGMTPFRGPTNETLFTVEMAMIHCVVTLTPTKYLAMVATISSTAAVHTITSLVALVLMFTTSESRTKRMSIRTRFINATDIHSATPRKLLFPQTHFKRAALSPLPTG